MALCAKLLALTQSCAGLSGGIARLWLFDPADFDWTQAAFSPTTGYAVYTAVALVTGGSVMYPMQFERYEAEYTYKQSKKGSFGKYEHQLEFKTPDLRQLITNWNYFIDAAGVCCGVGIVMQLNTGKILVLGEGVVNGDPIDIPMYIAQDGSSGTSGKLMDDFNGATVVLKGDSKRGAIEFTGGVQAIIDLQ